MRARPHPFCFPASATPPVCSRLGCAGRWQTSCARTCLLDQVSTATGFIALTRRRVGLTPSASWPKSQVSVQATGANPQSTRAGAWLAQPVAVEL
jgi:hypothetical protein